MQAGFDYVRAQVRAIVEQSPACHRLATLLRAMFQVAYTERDLFAIALTVSPALAGLSMRRDVVAGALAQVLFEARDRGGLADRDPELLAALLSGLVNQGVLWWLDHAQPGPEAMADEVLRLISGGLPKSLLAATPNEND